MNKLYTLPISVQAVDAFFKKSVLEKEEGFEIGRVNDAFILLFVLFQDFAKLKQIKFRGNLTNKSLQRAFEVINDLDVLLPKETPESLEKIRKGLLLLLNENKPKTINSDTANSILEMLQKEGSCWSDQGFAEFLNNAFEYRLEMSLEDLESLKRELAKVSHHNPQDNYENELRTKRETDLEIDRDICFRLQHNQKRDPSCLLLGNQGANQFKDLEPLSEMQRKIVDLVYKRRFEREGLKKGTDTASLASELGTHVRSINAQKSKIEKKVSEHLKTNLFAQDTQGNIVFPNNFSCMRSELRKKHQSEHHF